MCAHTRLKVFIFFPLSPLASLCRIQKLNEILRSDFLLPLLLPFDTSEGLSIGVHSGFNPHPVSVFFLPHGGDISSFVHLLPPNSTVDKCPFSFGCVLRKLQCQRATPTSTTCSSWLPSNQYVPSPTSSTTAVSLYCSVALARIPHSTTSSSKLAVTS